MNQRGLNEDLLNDIFEQDDKVSIMRIPVSTSKLDDSIVWKGEEKGHYIVKSCYRILQSDTQMNIFLDQSGGGGGRGGPR